ncbi:uncharacterized protein LOC128346393 isoform X2 [Hemicordylus capensis]|uniref:uncharacterized protein LOC128346393 isoform X2 n=1 Tax=Hemicordylus capensis TaxID=884348 RepID=UPI0023029939|nr:uncharacterized protein LOC128346393 isoform X2 [Hemicordylus capensis]XP_053155619.1 uncharacterized protein LOC128346393 isoform X2 [Hemicordylus capensis]
MGMYASHFHKNDGRILTKVTDPSQANWIAIHAETCKMTIPGAQRCWSCFLMLEPNGKGNLPQMRLLQQTKSLLGQKLLKQIPVTDDDKITFQTYCNAVSWLSRSSFEMKLKGLCQTVISGVLHKEQIQGLLSDLYPLENSSAITELSFCFLKEVDKSNQGFISEDMFMAWVQHLPRDIVESILKFPIIPPSLSDSKVPVSYMNIAEDDQDKQGLDDRQVFRVATELSRRKRNWKLLASKLGILEKNCSHLEHQNLEMKNQHSRWHAQSFQAISHPGTDHLELLSFSKILNMLQMWHRACQEAPLPTLQAALRESGNADICHEVFHLSF